MKNRFLFTILTLGGYCLLLGVGGFGYLNWAVRDHEHKGRLYLELERKVIYTEALRRDHIFNNMHDRDRANELYNEMKTIMRQFYDSSVVQINFAAMGVIVGAGILGLLYTVTGLAALVPVAWVKKALQAGIITWSMFVLFYGWNVYQEVDFIDSIYACSLQLVQYFLPASATVEYRQLVRQLTDFSISRSIVVLGVGSLLYFLGPLFLLSRPSVQAILTPDPDRRPKS